MSAAPNMLDVGSGIYLWRSKHPVDVWILTKKKEAILHLVEKNIILCVAQLPFIVYAVCCGKKMQVVK